MNGRDEEFGEFMRNRASLLHQSAYLLCGEPRIHRPTPEMSLFRAMSLSKIN
jgi:hypothetical protein